MLTQTHWKETFKFEPWNPTQMKAEHYTGLPGGYSTFYYNRIPVTTGLVGVTTEGYSAGRLILFAVLAAGIGVTAGYIASRSA